MVQNAESIKLKCLFSNLGPVWLGITEQSTSPVFV